MNTSTVPHGQPTLLPPQCDAGTEFDPFSNAKPCSPFYLYNHDSPRPSMELKTKPSLNVSAHDLEAGSEVLTPTTTQEKLDKMDSNKQPTTRVGVWRGRLFSKRCQQLTKPKQKGWLQRMPRRQRNIVKLVIAFLVIGCMVGIAVGIAAGLRSGVWKSNNQQGQIE